MDVSIASIDRKHLERLALLLRESIEDTCKKNRIVDRSIIEYEVSEKISKLEKYVSFGINSQSMICALSNGHPVAIGGYFRCGNDILSSIVEALETDLEIGSIYVAPDFQGLGIGRMIFEELKDRIRASGARQAFLNSGYRSSQAYWRKVLGEPCWDTDSSFGANLRCQIWKVDLV